MVSKNVSDISLLLYGFFGQSNWSSKLGISIKFQYRSLHKTAKIFVIKLFMWSYFSLQFLKYHGKLYTLVFLNKMCSLLLLQLVVFCMWHLNEYKFSNASWIMLLCPLNLQKMWNNQLVGLYLTIFMLSSWQWAFDVNDLWYGHKICSSFQK